jgi:regulator of cell morphogenesis and NO signaling
MTDLHDITLGALVVERPDAARVFERHGLDYCCGGRRAFAEACADAGLDADAVIAEIDAVPVAPQGWAGLTAPELARLIVDTHHRYLHEELPLLDALADKVMRAHVARHPELVEVRRLVGEIRADFEPHLLKEERVLFPAIAALAEGHRDFAFGEIDNPIRMMLFEHERTGELLVELRDAAGDYAVPPDGCASYRSLYERLAELEADTHEHVHKENNVLFPAASLLGAVT